MFRLTLLSEVLSCIRDHLVVHTQSQAGTKADSQPELRIVDPSSFDGTEMLACAYSMIRILFVPLGDAGRHRLGSPSLFMQGGTVSVGGKGNILATPQTYWLDSTVFPEWLGTSNFSLLVLLGTRRCCLPRSKTAAVSSWKQQALTTSQ